MKAIFRREFVSYFTTPIGYIFLAIFFALAGIDYSVTSLAKGSTGSSGEVQGYGTAELTQFFLWLLLIIVILIPILTMRTLSEDKRQKTDQVLLTSPVNLSGVVGGKFLASFVVYMIGISITLVFSVVVSAFAKPDWITIFGNIVGLLLLGAACISIGIFASSLTENQVISAVISLASIGLMSLLSVIASFIPIEFIQKILTKICFLERYIGFTYGQFDLSSALYFISVTVAFLFFTVRVLEKRRWA